MTWSDFGLGFVRWVFFLLSQPAPCQPMNPPILLNAQAHASKVCHVLLFVTPVERRGSCTGLFFMWSQEISFSMPFSMTRRFPRFLAPFFPPSFFFLFSSQLPPWSLERGERVGRMNGLIEEEEVIISFLSSRVGIIYFNCKGFSRHVIAPYLI